MAQFFPSLIPSADGKRVYAFRQVLDSLGNDTPEIWMSTGTAEGTKRIHTFEYHEVLPAAASIDSDLYLLHEQGPFGSGPARLLHLDGQSVEVLQTFADDSILGMTEAAGALYFTTHGTDTTTLWRSDGTVGTSQPLARFAKDREPNAVGRPVLIGGRYVFTLNDGVNGRELYKLSSSIAGNVFADVVADGVRNSGDYMVGGFRVFLDRNGDGWWNRGEIFTRTDEVGRYTLSDVPAGLYWLRVTHFGGWRFTTNDALRVRVTPGGDVIRHFGVTRNVLILGHVFMDANVSGGKDEAESGLPGWAVFVDADADGVLDPDELSVRTDAAGRFAIRTLAGGTHRIRVMANSNYRRTAPEAGYRDVSLLPGEIVTTVNFGQKRIVVN